MLDENETEFQYILQTKFSYANKGETVQAEFITLSAPTSRTTRECAALKQAFFRATNDQETTTTTRESDADLDIDGSDVMALLAISSSVDLPDVMDIGKKLFQMPGIALVDGETKLGSTLIDRMSVDDFESMLGEYFVNFILAFSLRKMKDKSSKA
jgi:hypothetical protein